MSRCPEPPAHRQARWGDEGARSKHHVRNPRHSGRNYREECNFSPDGIELKVFGSNMRDTCFPKRFQVPNNTIKYDG
jgi:hypothetical protein